MNDIFNVGYYTENDLKQAGIKQVGINVRIDRNCTIVGLQSISIGDNVRIDAYCTIIVPKDGFLQIGSYIHIAGYCYLGSVSGIVMEDFSGLAQKVSIYSRTDDYGGEYLTNPTVPPEYTGGYGGVVTLKRHAIVGSGSVILPGVTIGEGSSVGALSLINKNLDDWGVYAGSPARLLKARSKKLLEYEKSLGNKKL